MPGCALVTRAPAFRKLAASSPPTERIPVMPWIVACFCGHVTHGRPARCGARMPDHRGRYLPR
jgi:hypothetical protein